jgi:hypothetical protein
MQVLPCFLRRSLLITFLALRCKEKKSQNPRVNYFGIIANNFSKAAWSWGCSSEIDSTDRVLFTADAYSNDGRRLIILSDDKLSAFLELESAIRACGELC